MSYNQTYETKKARDFAIKAHGEQKYGTEPYVKHLDEVAEIVQAVSCEDTRRNRAIVVAYLHDVVEDTAITIEKINQEFDSTIGMAVAMITDEPGLNRKVRKKATYAKISSLDISNEWLPCLVKIADRLANVRACVRNKNTSLLNMYKKEHGDFRAAVYRPYKEWEPLMTELDDILR